MGRIKKLLANETQLIVQKKDTIVYESEQQAIKFNYPVNEIDGIVLAETLLQLSTILGEVKFNYPDCPNARIIVKVPEKGSFTLIYTIAEIVQQIDGQQIISVFKNTTEAVMYLGTLAFAINQIIELVQKLKGKKIVNEIDQGNTVEILTDTGDKYIKDKKTYKVLKSEETQKAVSKLFLILEQEKELNQLDSIEFHAPQGSPIVINNAEFKEIYNFTMQRHDQEKVKTELHSFQTLTTDSPHFTGNRKWEFFWNGVKNNFTIEKNILKVLQANRIGKRDKIIVDIEILKNFDEMVNDYVNKKYTVIKLHNFKPYEDQTLSLFPKENT